MKIALPESAACLAEGKRLLKRTHGVFAEKRWFTVFASGHVLDAQALIRYKEVLAFVGKGRP